jgi:hypothetical protein
MPMTSRRAFMKAASLAAAAPVSATAAGASPPPPPPLVQRAVYDDRFAAARAFGAEAARRGWAVASIKGDVTDFWYHELDELWRREPVALAGLTTDNSLWVLERLAWDRGLRVISRREHAEDELVSWIIAPKSNATRSARA